MKTFNQLKERTLNVLYQNRRRRIAKMKTINLFVALLLVGLLLALSAGGTTAQGPVPKGLVLWNKLGSQAEVENSEVGPDGFFDNAEGQLTFVPGQFGNGVNYPFYEHHGGSKNKVAFDLSSTGLTTEEGAIEFWWTAGYTDNTQSGDDSHRYFLNTADTAIHPPDPGHSPGTGFVVFENSNFTPSKPNLLAGVGEHGTGLIGWAETDPDSHDFDEGDQIHWAIAYDVNGIGNTGKTIILHKNGIEIAAATGTWPSVPIKVLWLGVMSRTWYNQNTRQLGYGSAAGVYDNLIIWNYAKTDFSDRFNEAPTIVVPIDIKPGSDPNSINLKSKGVVPVAVLTTDAFDASNVDPDTVKFAGASPKRWTIEDVDGDGDADLLFHFKTQELLDLGEGSTEATLTGYTYDAYGGYRIQGTDTVNIVPKGK